MIKNFKKLTKPLSEYEETVLLPMIKDILLTCQGQSRSLTNKKIIDKLQTDKKQAETRIRKVINSIRNRGIIPCLIAGENGYFIASTPKEVTDYELSLYDRADAILHVQKSIHEHAEKVFGKEAMRQASADSFKERKEDIMKYQLSLKLKLEQKKKKKIQRKSVLRLKPKKKSY